MLFQTHGTPKSRKTSEPTKEALRPKTVLLLGPQQPTPYIQIESAINVKTEKCLFIKNPSNVGQKLTVSKFPPEERLIILNQNEITIPPKSESTLLFSWTPKVTGAWQDILQLTDDHKWKYNILLETLCSITLDDEEFEGCSEALRNGSQRVLGPLNNNHSQKRYSSPLPLRKQPQEPFDGKENFGYHSTPFNNENAIRNYHIPGLSDISHIPEMTLLPTNLLGTEINQKQMTVPEKFENASILISSEEKDYPSASNSPSNSVDQILPNRQSKTSTVLGPRQYLPIPVSSRSGDSGIGDEKSISDEEKEMKRQKAAVLLQARWRGLSSRKRHYVKKAAKPALSPSTVAHGLKKDMNLLMKTSKIDQQEGCLLRINKIMRLTVMGCIKFCDHVSIDKVYDLLKSFNRSETWGKEARKAIISILITLAKLPNTAHRVKRLKDVRILASMMFPAANKDTDLFIYLSTLLWILGLDEQFKEVIVRDGLIPLIVMKSHSLIMKEKRILRMEDIVLPNMKPDWGFITEESRWFCNVKHAVSALKHKFGS